MGGVGVPTAHTTRMCGRHGRWQRGHGTGARARHAGPERQSHTRRALPDMHAGTARMPMHDAVRGTAEAGPMGNHGKNTMDAGGARGTRASRAEDAGAERGRRRRERGRRARRGPRQGAGPTHGQAEGPTGVAARRGARGRPQREGAAAMCRGRRCTGTEARRRGRGDAAAARKPRHPRDAHTRRSPTRAVSTN